MQRDAAFLRQNFHGTRQTEAPLTAPHARTYPAFQPVQRNRAQRAVDGGFDFAFADLLTAAQKEQLATLRGEIERNINRMNDVTKMLAQNYPKAFRHALTVKSIRMLLTYERRTIRKLQNDGVISEKDAERLIEKVDERTDEGNSFRYTVLGTLLRGIVHGAKKKGTEKQTPTEP